MRHIVEEIHLRIATEHSLDRFGDIVSDGGPVGMSEVGTGIPRSHIELAILTSSIIGEKLFLGAEIIGADFGGDGVHGFLERSEKKQASQRNHNRLGEVFAFFGGIHIHRVLTQDTGAAVHHKNVLTLRKIELSGRFFIDNIGDFHQIKEMIASRPQNAGADLREEKKQLGDDIENILGCYRRFPEEIAPFDTVYSLVFGLYSQVFDEWRYALAADIHDNSEGEVGADEFLGWHDLYQSLEEFLQFFGSNIGIIQIGTDEAHAAGRIRVIDLREDVFL